jgi:uncharacterized membrane protein YeaQ/YmgE (transglycosylase-associated protein family)
MLYLELAVNWYQHDHQNNFSLPALMVSLLGAIVLMAVVNLFRRGGAFR